MIEKKKKEDYSLPADYLFLFFCSQAPGSILGHCLLFLILVSVMRTL